MRMYGRQFEDPHSGPAPTKKSYWLGAKRRQMKKRKARSHKKSMRQQLKKIGE